MHSSRTRASTALALASALALMLCTWLLIRTSAPAKSITGASRLAADVGRAPEDSSADTPSARTPVASHASPAAATAVSAQADVLSQPETLVHGWLLDADAGPMGGGRSTRISFVDSAGKRRSTAFDESGRYAMPLLDLGTYWVTASVPGYLDHEQQIELNHGQPMLRRDFTLQKAVELCIEVTTPDGRDALETLRASELTTLATRTHPNDEQFGVPRATIAIGELPFVTSRCAGTLRLDGELPAWVSLVQQDAILTTRRVHVGQDTVTFVIALEDLMAAQSTLRARATDARIEHEVALEGRVLDSDGNSLTASFELGVHDAQTSAIRWIRNFRTRGNGSFKLQGLAAAEYLIRTTNHDTYGESDWKGTPWVSGIRMLDTRGGSRTGVEVRLEPATRLVLRMSSGSSDGLRFCVRDEDGHELVGGSLRGSQPRSLDLPAGDYSVSVQTAQGSVISQRPITLGSKLVELDLAR